MKRLIAATALFSMMTSTALANPVGGAVRTTDIVEAHSRNCYTVELYAHETTMIVLSGDGDTDLDLYVYDENDNLVASDRGYSDDAAVTVRPRWTGRFRVCVVNLGDVYNRFTIAAW